MYAIMCVLRTPTGEDPAGHWIADAVGRRVLRDALGYPGQRREGPADDPREDRQHQRPP